MAKPSPVEGLKENQRKEWLKTVKEKSPDEENIRESLELKRGNLGQRVETSLRGGKTKRRTYR